MPSGSTCRLWSARLDTKFQSRLAVSSPHLRRVSTGRRNESPPLLITRKNPIAKNPVCGLFLNCSQVSFRNFSAIGFRKNRLGTIAEYPENVTGGNSRPFRLRPRRQPTLLFRFTLGRLRTSIDLG